MVPRLGAGLRSAHVTRMVMASASAAALTAASTGVGLAVDVASVGSTPVGTVSTTASTGSSGANVNVNVTGAGPTHGSVPGSVNVNTQQGQATVTSQSPSIVTSGVGSVQVPAVPVVTTAVPDQGSSVGTPGRHSWPSSPPLSR